MVRSPSAVRPRGVTLIELLVVIALIAILIGPACLFKDKRIFKPPGIKGYGMAANLYPGPRVRQGFASESRWAPLGRSVMRSDMAKVIVERPRHGSRRRGKPKGARRRAQRFGADGGPRREGIRRPHLNNAKSLNEHLGPLRRYLESQVGRPWDKVFSEICTHINRRSAVQDHVRDHVADIVETHVILIDGAPCYGSGRRYGQPLQASRWWGALYVCPATGLLKRARR